MGFAGGCSRCLIERSAKTLREVQEYRVKHGRFPTRGRALHASLVVRFLRYLDFRLPFCYEIC